MRRVPIRLSCCTRYSCLRPYKYSDHTISELWDTFQDLPHPLPTCYPPEMMFTKSLMTSFFALMSLLALVMSIPIQKRDVFVPPVISPHQGTVWYAGREQEVIWDTKNAPVNITNSEGIIYLVVDNLIDFNYELASRLQHPRWQRASRSTKRGNWYLRHRLIRRFW
ncbi:hypothetical protein EDD16DRAFT_1157279 [Pisolithus croceorrhizus]|nr:hypothetical protein EDD16DRAFT_1157279 [Pisolithus croceorrhizus]